MKKKKTDIEEQLKQAILTCGISSCALAKRAGINRSVLSNFLNGHRSLTLPTAAKVAGALGLELVQTSPMED